MEQPYISFCQYHSYWCFGNFRYQCISRHGITHTKPEYSVSTTRRINWFIYHKHWIHTKKRPFNLYGFTVLLYKWPMVVVHGLILTDMNKLETILRLTKTQREWHIKVVPNNMCTLSVYMSWLISPSATYMRWRIGSTLVQIMTCHLFGTKPLSKPMLGYCQVGPCEQPLVKF